jgi:type II secretory pathway pseudopilin PulG
MAWIKRNLLFVIGAVIAVGLLLAAGAYDFENWQRNNDALKSLNQMYDTLRKLGSQTPSPGNDKINNIQTAREQARRLREWIQQARQYFQPIPSVPVPTNGVITDAQFAAARDHTLNQLQIEAANASVSLPPQYGFSFEAERTLVKFAPSGLNALAQQLGEVKTICEIFYAAKVNSLDDIRRVRVSSDDVSGPQSDYLDGMAVTNQLAVFMPYEVSFRGFSQDLAKVLSSLASSPHGLIVKGINVQPAVGASSVSSPSGAPAPGGSQSSPYAPSAQWLPYVSSPAPTTGGGGLQTVLNEQLLSITLDIDIVKLSPGN